MGKMKFDVHSYELSGGTVIPYASSPHYEEKRETQIIVSIDDGNGAIHQDVKLLESVINPLDVLSYDDFRLSNLLKAGVKPQAIKLVPDHRLGVDDSVISSFNDHVDDLFTNVEQSNN